MNHINNRGCSCKNFLCGVFFGLTTGWFLSSYMEHPKKVKRKAKKYTNAVGDLLDNVHYIFK